MPGETLSDFAQLPARLGQVGGAHGVAVHGRVGVVGHVYGRADRLGQYATQRIAQIQPFPTGDGIDLLEDAFARLLQRQRRAVVAATAAGLECGWVHGVSVHNISASASRWSGVLTFMKASGASSHATRTNFRLAYQRSGLRSPSISLSARSGARRPSKSACSECSRPSASAAEISAPSRVSAPA